MQEEALIIFVRKPEPGKVKTRLAAAIGGDAALNIYQQLLAHTHAVSAEVPCDRFVFYATQIVADDLWADGYTKLLQIEADLGGRMKAAFAHLFGLGYRRVCIIGSDCFELTAGIIRQAFYHLTKNDVVLGPAKDGGYYLLGMRDGLKAVFDGVEWSTENVLEQTKHHIGLRGYAAAFLQPLTDVDTVDDLPAELLDGLQWQK